MKELFYLLPLAGAISGLSTALLGLILMRFILKEDEVNPVLDEQLDELVVTFQQEIPMAAMFLKGKMVETLKKRAREKLLGALPKIKEKFLNKILWKWLLVGTVTGFVIGLLFNLLVYKIIL